MPVISNRSFAEEDTTFVKVHVSAALESSFTQTSVAASIEV